jgi:LPXTG-motif cell wall-anchored protein
MLSLYINGSKVGQISLPNLANWNMWDFQSETISLNAGENKITYQMDPGDSGDVLLDSIILTKLEEPTPVPTENPANPTPTSVSKTSTSTTGLILLVGLIVLILLAAGYIMLRRKSSP